jgi:hypothetical protein
MERKQVLLHGHEAATSSNHDHEHFLTSHPRNLENGTHFSYFRHASKYDLVTLKWAVFPSYGKDFMKNAVFWDVEPCRHCVNRRFGGTYRLHLKGRRKNQQMAAD